MQTGLESIPNSVNLTLQPGRCVEPQAVKSVAARFGLAPAPEAGAAEARAFAAGRLGEAMASAEALAAIQTRTKAALFAARGPDGALTGVFAGFALNAAGAGLCAQQSFDAIVADPGLACAPGEAPHAWYGWGFVASTKRAAYAVVAAARAIQSELYWAVPAYARAVTADGARATTRIGYRPLSPAAPSWVWIPPRDAPLAQVRS